MGEVETRRRPRSHPAQPVVHGRGGDGGLRLVLEGEVDGELPHGVAEGDAGPGDAEGSEDVDPDQRAPQILLYSTGELSLFELDLRRGRNGEGFRIAPAEGTDHIETRKLEATR